MIKKLHKNMRQSKTKPIICFCPTCGAEYIPTNFSWRERECDNSHQITLKINNYYYL